MTILSEDSPMWEASSNSARHDGVPWTLPRDVGAARSLLAQVRGKLCGTLLEILLSEPGRMVTSEEIVALEPGAFKSIKAVSGCLTGLVVPTDELHKPFPIHWWGGTLEDPTRYAVRPSVAAVFVPANR